jgi:hypothetical protein
VCHEYRKKQDRRGQSRKVAAQEKNDGNDSGKDCRPDDMVFADRKEDSKRKEQKQSRQ